MRAWLCVLALAGCDRVFGIGDPYEDARPLAIGSDAMPDMSIDTATVPNDVIGMPMPALLERYAFDGTLENASNTASATTTGNFSLQSTGGQFGGEISVDGTGCVTFPFSPQPSTFSIVVWAEERNANATYVPLLVRPHVTASTVQDWAFYADDQSVDFFMSASVGPAQTYPAAPGLSTGWRQYVVTFDGSNVHVYVDGTDAGGVPGTIPAYGGGSTVYLGCDGAGGTNAKFAGSFDEIEIYDGALTLPQIMALRTAPPS